jgi:uncharacterized protein (DUF58 family)
VALGGVSVAVGSTTVAGAAALGSGSAVGVVAGGAAHAASANASRTTAQFGRIIAAYSFYNAA